MDKVNLSFQLLSDFLSSNIVNSTFTTEQQDYRYVIYARKSSEDDEKQERSLVDQIRECQDLVTKLGLKLGNPPIIQEAMSSKESGVRKGFRLMIDKIERGEYDGIITWHPNRLSRNMREAGEIIDLVDKKIIKDLKFCSYLFNNDPSGKLMLGIVFALSKQYSDQLSVDIKRGVKNSVQDGKFIGKLVHGYYRDTNQFLRPDRDNFNLIRDAFIMRSEGKGISEIKEYVNSSGYTKAVGIGGKDHIPHHFSDKDISRILKNPIYVGLNKYGSVEEVTNLNSIYNFVPVIEPELFCQINKISDKSKIISSGGRGYTTRKNLTDKFLNGCVFCTCGKKRTVQIVSKKLKEGTRKYVTFRCDNSRCKYRGKSIRANVVTTFIYEFLRSQPFISEESYLEYSKRTEVLNQELQKQIQLSNKSIQSKLHSLRERRTNLSDYLSTSTDKTVKISIENDLKVIIDEISKHDGEIVANNQKLISLNGGLITYEKYIELFKKLPSVLEKTKMLDKKEEIIKNIFLNFTVDNQKVLKYKLNEPFESMLKVANTENSHLVEMGGIEPPSFRPN